MDSDLSMGESVDPLSMYQHAVPSTPHISGIASTFIEPLFPNAGDSGAVRDFAQKMAILDFV